MTRLPPGWVLTTIGDTCEVIQGQSPPGSSYNTTGIGLPFFQGKAEFGDLYPSVRKWTTDPKKIADKDDVLLSIRAPVGPTNLAPMRCVVGRGLAAIRPRADIAARFVLYWLRSSEAVLAAGATGSTFEAVSGSQVREHQFPLPPLKEQRRIVAAIEEHLSRLDAAGTSLAAANRRLRGLQSKILENEFALDAPKVEIGSIARVGSGATPKRGQVEYWEGGTIPWVTSGQLNASYVREPAALITDQALRRTNVKLWQPGTLLVALYGEGKTRGRCAELTIEATTNQACAAVVLDESIADRVYVRRFFDANYEVNRRLAAGGVQPNLSLGLIRELKIPLPPLDEQRRVVAQLEEELSTVAALRAAIERAQRRSASLRRAVLEHAFRGELVPQDPSDEPASVLLERIRPERAAIPARPRSRRVNT